MPQLLYRKELTTSDVTEKLFVETKHLADFPPFPPGHHFQILRFLDEEEGTEWNFRLAVRQTGRYPKPYIGGDWIQFCKRRELKEGRVIQFFKERNEATGQVNYTIRPFYNFL
ncbi:hypothetical protein Patl1_21799 [Pistacia atlantica]|uniref:Uncharacterized protein n=1 Tax=Pistacia atlantica TaxID=434234 RepID=A0ACC1BJ45_9ROSI|nr:hypothetical protein Patl1_21799 [Pistacia atlantica]